jgi:hypothetical protein
MGRRRRIARIRWIDRGKCRFLGKQDKMNLQVAWRATFIIQTGDLLLFFVSLNAWLQKRRIARYYKACMDVSVRGARMTLALVKT